MTYWNRSEVFDSDDTMALQRHPDASDLAYLKRVRPDAEAKADGAQELTDAEYQEWVNLVDAAPALLAAVRAILFQATQGPVLERDACITQARDAYKRAMGVV